MRISIAKFTSCLILLLSVVTTLKAANKVPKTLGVITDVQQLNGTQTGAMRSFQYKAANMKIDANTANADSVELRLKVYIENVDNPGDISVISKATQARMEIGNTQSNKDLVSWKLTSLNLKSGWTDLRLKLKSGTVGSGFTLSKALEHFRFMLIFNRKYSDTYLIRLKDVKVVDPTVLVDDTTATGKTYVTTPHVADIDFSVDQTMKAGRSLVKSITFDPIDVSRHDIKQLYLQFDADITEGKPGDILLFNHGDGQIELTSAGICDKEEISWTVKGIDWRAGHRTYRVPFTSTWSTGQINYSAINYMRMFLVGVPSNYTGTLGIKVSNVSIVDLTNDRHLPTIFSDGMLYQQHKPMVMWGYSKEGTNIKADLLKDGQVIETQIATTPSTGKWTLQFGARDASNEKYTINVYEDGNLFQTVNDILVGELWIAAGQSNMYMPVNEVINADELMESADNDMVRFYNEPLFPSSASWTGTQPRTVEKDIKGAGWGSGNNGLQVGQTTAVGYIMACNLQKRLGIPVGILYTPVGGSPIESWIPREAVDNNKQLKKDLLKRNMYYDEEWWKDDASTLTALYNQKVGPLAGLPIAGVFWYQGEANADRPEIYSEELTTMRKGWDKAFGFNGDMPFVLCQVARWSAYLERPQQLAYLDEAMADSWKEAPEEMSLFPLYDVDQTYDRPINPDPIHPSNKMPVGEEFARAIYNKVYYGTKVSTGAVATNFTKSGNHIIVTFDNVGDGLTTSDSIDDVHGFTLSADDGVYVNARARIISKNQVEVWNDNLLNPTRVTYAFCTFNQSSNLCNSEHFGAIPFRSDRSEGQQYFNPQDWTYADGTYWGVNGNGKVEFLQAWTSGLISGKKATVSYDTTQKTEGKASVKATYESGQGTAGLCPIITHKTTVSQLASFKYISADVINPDDRQKSIKLMLKDANNNVYTVVPDVSLLPAKATVRIEFQLDNMTDASGNKVSNAANVLKDVNAIEFVVNDNEQGSFCIDNILFGTSPMKTVTDGIDLTLTTPQNGTFVDAYDLSGRKIDISNVSFREPVIVRSFTKKGLEIRKVLTFESLN